MPVIQTESNGNNILLSTLKCGLVLPSINIPQTKEFIRMHTNKFRLVGVKDYRFNIISHFLKFRCRFPFFNVPKAKRTGFIFLSVTIVRIVNLVCAYRKKQPTITTESNRFDIRDALSGCSCSKFPYLNVEKINF